jgi:hypothetical protein
MALSTEQRQQIKYFTGTEVEHTDMLGAKTLFVVSVQPVKEIIRQAQDCQHIYLGTSQSFPGQHSMKEWTLMIEQLLSWGYTVTLDYDCQYAEQVTKQTWSQHANFVNMVSVCLPYIEKMSARTFIKLDDQTWGATNPGVWVHKLRDLKDYSVFTGWNEYQQDGE